MSGFHRGERRQERRGYWSSSRHLRPLSFLYIYKKSISRKKYLI